MRGSSRRRFLEISAGLAGRVAASGAVSLPILASMSKGARAHDRDRSEDHDRDDRWERHHCFLHVTRILTPGGEIPVEALTIGTLVDTFDGPLPVQGQPW